MTLTQAQPDQALAAAVRVRRHVPGGEADRRPSGSGPVEPAPARAAAGVADARSYRRSASAPCRRRCGDGTSRAGPYAALGDAYLQKARETFDPSYYARAETALREALRRDPREAGALTAMGVARERAPRLPRRAALRRARAGGSAQRREAVRRDRRRARRARPLRGRRAGAAADGRPEAEPRLLRAGVLLPGAARRPDRRDRGDAARRLRGRRRAREPRIRADAARQPRARTRRRRCGAVALTAWLFPATPNTSPPRPGSRAPPPRAATWPPRSAATSAWSSVCRCPSTRWRSPKRSWRPVVARPPARTSRWWRCSSASSAAEA